MSNDERAQQEEAFRWQLTNAPRPARPVFKPDEKGYGPEFCADPDCEEPMPAPRRADGQRMCTECTGLAERRKARGF